MRILGIDPGLRSTGWGVISIGNGCLRHIANGAIQPKPALPDADRLRIVFDGLAEVIAQHRAMNPPRARSDGGATAGQQERPAAAPGASGAEAAEARGRCARTWAWQRCQKKGGAIGVASAVGCRPSV